MHHEDTITYYGNVHVLVCVGVRYYFDYRVRSTAGSI